LRSKLSRGAAAATPAAPHARPRGVAASLPALLSALGLSQYLPAFEAEEIDSAALAHCTDADLQALGLPMGPRKKLLAMLPH
jgi:phospholipase DDHD2